MFQQPPPRRHRRLPTGTMVSYAEVKSYLSKREIPQLFESLMAGLMYHRPENHIGYLQSCLEEVKSNSDTKVQWSTFVNAKKRKSREILPPLTPKKESHSSSFSDNSRQSTPLPPISARTRTRTLMEQQDYRNTYILYHNPPPILAKPKVPVVSVLGGLGTKIDELCERVVGRLRGVVHISTCSMLKTRMTIEGFYRVTSVPACAVVDSVLQAMSMVQSASALLVAGFPRNRGDIEEYKSRRVRMDGVILVDFEEEALRHFLEHEVATGVVRTSEIDGELERFKQDIISVAEYYDEKELLTVVMGDQDLEEIIDDLVIAVDKVIETRKNLVEEDEIDDKKEHECGSPVFNNVLMTSPDKIERPSTVEIRDATEEDIKSIEEEAKQTKTNEETDEVANIMNTEQIESDEKLPIEVDTAEAQETDIKLENAPQDSQENDLQICDKEPVETKDELQSENRQVSEDEVKENEEEKIEDKIDNEENLAENNNENDTSDEAKKSEKLDDPSKSKDENPDDEQHDLEKNVEETLKTEKPNIPLIFAFENINADYDEIKNLIANDLEMCFIDFQELMRNDGNDDDKFDTNEALSMLNSILKQDSVSYSNGFFIYKFPFALLNENFMEHLSKLGNLSFVFKVRENKPDSESEAKEIEEEKLFHSSRNENVRIIFVTEDNILDELRSTLQEIANVKNAAEEIKDDAEKCNNAEFEKVEENDKEIKNVEGKASDEEGEPLQENEEINQPQENEELVADDKTEDSTGKDIEDLVSDDTLNEDPKPPDSLKTDENQDVIPVEVEVDDTHSQASTIASAGDETQKERAVLERQLGVEMETDNMLLHAESGERKKPSLIRQSTYSAGEETKDESKEDDEIKKSSKDSISAAENQADENAENNEVVENDSVADGNTNDNVLEPVNKETDLENEQDQSETQKIAEKELEDKEHEDDKEGIKDEADKEGIKDEDDKEGIKDEDDKEGIKDEEDKEGIKDEEDKETRSIGSEGNNEKTDSEKEEQNPEVEAIEEESTKDEKNSVAETNEENAEKTEIEIDQQSQETKAIENEENQETEVVDEENEKPEVETGDDSREDKTQENAIQNEAEEDNSPDANNGIESAANHSEHENNSEGHASDIVNETCAHDEQDNSKTDENVETPENPTGKNSTDDNELNNDEDASKNALEQNETSENKNATDSEVDSEKIKSAESPDVNSELNEENEIVEEKSEQENAVSENKSEEKLNENDSSKHETSLKNEEPDTEENNISEQKSESNPPKVNNASNIMDNDSDSNDENVTIETKAEIHAIDCISPQVAEAEKAESNHEEADKIEAENPTSENETVDNKNEDLNTDNITSSNNRILNVSENELNKENVLENNESDVLLIKDIDNVGSERLSGKIQERNGSGILDESREQDGRESEEPQERSSSSSRGEL